MAPGVVGSIPISHPHWVRRNRLDRSVAQLVEHRSPKPAVGGSSPPGLLVAQPPQREKQKVESRHLGRIAVRRRRLSSTFYFQRFYFQRFDFLGRAAAVAVSSRGLGRSPLKAQTRVRIPLPLWRTSRVHGPMVYRLGRHPFKVERRVRLPVGAIRSGLRPLESRRTESRK